MAKGFNIRAWLGLDTKKFTKGLNHAQKRVSVFNRGLRATNDVLRGLKFAAVGVTAAGAFTRAIEVVRSFENQMARVKVLSGATTEEMSKMEGAAREIGATTRFSATEAAGGLQYLSMAGLDVNESLDALAPTMNLAGAGMVDVGRSADILTNILSGFNMESKEATRVADLFAHTTSVSNQNLEELYEGVNKIAPAYNNLGISVEEAARDMALLANNGIKGSEAGTALAGSLSRLLRQPQMVGKALKELNVEVSESTIRQDGLVGTMEKLRDAGINATQMTQIFGLHWKTAGALVGMSSEKIAEMSDEIEKSEGRAEQMSKEGIGSLDESIKLLMSALDELFISLGKDGLSGAIVSLIDNVRDIVLWFTKMSTTSKVLSGTLLAMVLNIGKLNNAFRILSIGLLRGSKGMAVATKGMKAFTMSLRVNPVTAIATAIIGLALALDSFIESNKRARKEKFDYFKDLREQATSESTSKLTDDELVKKYKHLGGEIKRIKASLEEGGQSVELDANLRSQIKNYEAIRKALMAEAVARDELKKAKKEEAEQDKKIAENAGSWERRKIEWAEKLQSKLKAIRADVWDEDDMDVEPWMKAKDKPDDSEGDAFMKDFQNQQFEGISSGAEALQEYFDASKLADEATKNYNKSIDELNNSMNEFVLDSLGDSLNGVSKLLDDDAKKWVKFASTIANQMAKVGKAMEDFQAKKEAIQAAADAAQQAKIAKDSAAASAGIAINTAAAAGNAAKDTSNIPFGWLAIPAVIAAVVGMFSALPKFATGAIVGGNQTQGDKVPAMLNSGEMVLNKAQQGNLFAMANGGVNNGGSVEFKIKGTELVGVLNKQSRRDKKSN